MQRDWKDLPEPRSVHQPITSITGFGSETLGVLRTRTPTNESPCCCSGRHATLAALKTRESKCRAIALHIIPGCVILSQKSHYITLKKEVQKQKLEEWFGSISMLLFQSISYKSSLWCTRPTVAHYENQHDCHSHVPAKSKRTYTYRNCLSNPKLHPSRKQLAWQGPKPLQEHQEHNSTFKFQRLQLNSFCSARVFFPGSSYSNFYLRWFQQVLTNSSRSFHVLATQGAS